MSTTTSPDWEAWQTSFMNEAFTNLRRFTSIPFLPEKMERVRKGVTPREIIYEEDRLKVYHYIRRGRTQVQNAPLFRVRSGEPALHHGSQGRPEYRRKLR